VERADHSFETQLVVGEFAATIETVENANDPVIVTASVGWSDSQAFQKYDFDETFCMPGQSPFPEQS
jgi:hypothetical protein